MAALVLIGSFVGSSLTEESLWFARAGSITTVFGLLITIKHNVLASDRDLDTIVMEKRHYANWAPEPGSDDYLADLRYAKKVMRDEYIGLVMTLFGTVIWGYGDLIHNLIHRGLSS